MQCPAHQQRPQHGSETEQGHKPIERPGDQRRRGATTRRHRSQVDSAQACAPCKMTKGGREPPPRPHDTPSSQRPQDGRVAAAATNAGVDEVTQAGINRAAHETHGNTTVDANASASRVQPRGGEDDGSPTTELPKQATMEDDMRLPVYLLWKSRPEPGGSHMAILQHAVALVERPEAPFFNSALSTAYEDLEFDEGLRTPGVKIDWVDADDMMDKIGPGFAEVVMGIASNKGYQGRGLWRMQHAGTMAMAFAHNKKAAIRGVAVTMSVLSEARMSPTTPSDKLGPFAPHVKVLSIIVSEESDKVKKALDEAKKVATAAQITDAQQRKGVWVEPSERQRPERGPDDSRRSRSRPRSEDNRLPLQPFARDGPVTQGLVLKSRSPERKQRGGESHQGPCRPATYPDTPWHRGADTKRTHRQGTHRGER